MNNKYYDVVIVGNYTKDTIIYPNEIKHVDGGGFNYGAHVAAMMGLKVAAVTRLAKEDIHVVHNLTNIGVDVFPYYSPKSTHMHLNYPTSNVDERILTVESVADPFSYDQIEEFNAKAFLLNGSIRSEITLEVIKELRKKETLIAADIQSFIRVIANGGTLVYEEWDEKEEVLSLVDILKTDAVEAEFLTGVKDIKKQAKILSDFGPKEIVLTHRNGILIYVNGNFYEEIFTPKKLVGRSGRGDTCISSYVFKRITSSPEESIIWSAAVTSLKMEAEGPLLRKIEEVEDHISKYYN